MIDKLEKIFNPATLLIINIIIILITEFTGDSYYFYQTGLIHAIAIAFIFLSASRIFTHYHITDQYLKKFLQFSLLALVIFAASHIIEFLSYVVFIVSEDAIFANVANFYIISIISIIIGAEFILKTYRQRSPIIIWLSSIIILLFLILTIAFLTNDQLISLEPDGTAPWLYIVIVLIISIIGLINLWRLKKIISMLAPFINYLFAGLILITLATVPNIFYEIFEETFGFPKHQIIYLSHFAFYIALSLLFLSFGKLLNLGGIYAEARQETIKQEN